MVKQHSLACSVTFAALGALVLATATGAGEVHFGHAVGGVCPDCDFSGRDLSDASVVGNLPRSDFSGATLAGARISGNFASASFARADLTGASLQSANLVNSDLSGAKLDGAHVSGTIFFGADLTGASLRNTRASWSNFSSSNFLGAKLNGVELSAVDASRSEFTHADLTDASLSGADFTDARFEDASLRGADLTGANLTGAAFTGADLTDAMLDGAVLAHADLSEAVGLVASALASACGDVGTKLPQGLSVSACPTSSLLGMPQAAAQRFGAEGPRASNGGDRGGARTFPFAQPYAPRSVEALLSEMEPSRRAAQDLAHAQRALATAYAASHAELDLGVREAIMDARDSLADLDVAELLGTDADVTDVIATIDRIRPGADGADVAAALTEAHTALDAVVTDMVDVRDGLRTVVRSGSVSSIDHERDKRNARLDREYETRERRLDREIDARLRTLEAECEHSLYDLDHQGAQQADQKASVEADCHARETAINVERDQRLEALTAEIDAERARIETDLAELARQMNLLNEQWD